MTKAQRAVHSVQHTYSTPQGEVTHPDHFVGAAIVARAIIDKDGNVLVAGDAFPAISGTAGSNIVLSGAYVGTFTFTGTTGVTFPTTGTLATRAGTETLTNKTLTSPILTTPALGVATGTSLALTAGLTEGVTTISGDGAVTLASGTVILTKGSAAAISVAAPSSQDGTKIRIISNSDFAHVITFTGSTLLDGTTGANLTVTMTAFKGSAIEFVASGTKWLLVSSSNVTSITA